MRTNIYVDGFNQYYSAVRGTPWRWLDIAALCRVIFPKNEIGRIRYFTARVSGTPDDPGKPTRQNLYLRALGTTPNLTIHFGRFTSHARRMPLAQPQPSGSRMVDVIYTEEKGSDVNLASYLLLDGFRHNYEAAIVVSNDSDLVEPIRMVRSELNLPVGVLNPQHDGHKVARVLRSGVLL